MYAVYKKNNQINLKISTNMGSSWGSPYTYNLINTGCNDIKAIIAQNSIHIVWSELRTGSSNIYDVHYVEFYYSEPTWQNYKRVTDIEDNGGEIPQVTN